MVRAADVGFLPEELLAQDRKTRGSMTGEAHASGTSLLLSEVQALLPALDHGLWLQGTRTGRASKQQRCPQLTSR